MHEWSLAEAVINSLIKFGEERGVASIEEVEVTYGEIMELEVSIFETAFEQLSKGTPLEGTKLVLKEEKAKFKCNACGAEWDFETVERILSDEFSVVEEPHGTRESPLHFLPQLAPALLKCPSCGSRDFDLTSGKGMRISKVVVKT